MDDDDLLNIDLKHDLNAKQAAEFLFCSESQVYWLLTHGSLRGYRTGRRRGWRIPKKSIDEYYARLRMGPDGI